MTLYTLDGVSPRVHETAWIAPGAVLIGDVVLEEGASVWFNAVLRGDNERITIGKGSNVQDNCVLHTDPGFPLTLGENVTVGHNAIVHGCSVGQGTLIGMGATVMNGSKIGAGVVIGANALVPEGKEIPDGKMALGAPAKAIRALSPEEIAALQKPAERYRKNARRYREGLSETDRS